jgi:hypothetical protein
MLVLTVAEERVGEKLEIGERSVRYATYPLGRFPKLWIKCSCTVGMQRRGRSLTKGQDTKYDGFAAAISSRWSASVIISVIDA